MNWKSTAAVSGVTLLATWLGWTPARYSSPTDAPAVLPEAQRPVASDIQEQATRLQSRLRSDELGYHDPKRNPFRFAARPAPVAQPAAEPLPVIPYPAVPDRLPFTLSGLATDTVDGEVRRTVILTSGTDVLFVKQGDQVGGYIVTRVDDGGVDFTGADGVVRRLPLAP